MSDIVGLDTELITEVIEFKIQQRQIVLAKMEDRLVGYIRLDPIWNKIPYIGLIWVDPDLRGQGLGKTVLGWLIEELKQTGHTELYSSSQTDEEQPQKWHRSAGFLEAGTINDINGPGVGELFFRMSLTSNQ